MKYTIRYIVQHNFIIALDEFLSHAMNIPRKHPSSTPPPPPSANFIDEPTRSPHFYQNSHDRIDQSRIDTVIGLQTWYLELLHDLLSSYVVLFVIGIMASLPTEHYSWDIGNGIRGMYWWFLYAFFVNCVVY